MPSTRAGGSAPDSAPLPPRASGRTKKPTNRARQKENSGGSQSSRGVTQARGLRDLVRTATLAEGGSERRSIDKDILLYMIDRADATITLFSNSIRSNTKK